MRRRAFVVSVVVTSHIAAAQFQLRGTLQTLTAVTRRPYFTRSNRLRGAAAVTLFSCVIVYQKTAERLKEDLSMHSVTALPTMKMNVL